MEVTVTFEPKESKFFTAEAYLEVSGRENRLSLQLKGQGLGPKIIVSPSTLDIDYVYLCSSHTYEARIIFT